MQDEIALIEDELRFTIGSKVEHNDTTGLRIQPQRPHPVDTDDEPVCLGSSVAGGPRAVLGEEDARIRVDVIPPATLVNPMPFPTEIVFTGKPDIVAEDLLSFELGYRAQPIDGLSFDIAGFYNIYDDLRTVGEGAPFLRALAGPARRRSVGANLRRFR